MRRKYLILLAPDAAEGTPPAVVIPKSAKDVKGIRSMMTSIKTQLCSAAEAFSAPLKEMFSEVGKKFEAVIAALPKEDGADWSVECQLENLFGCLACASGAASQAALEISKLREEKAELSRQFAANLEAEIAKKINAGELFSKDAHTKALEGLVPQATVTQLCAEAQNKGMEAGMKKLRDEQAVAEANRTVITTRRAALQKANFPIPDAQFESALGGEEKDFEAAKKLVETRRDGLKQKGIQLNTAELQANLWLPEAQWNVFEKTVSNIPALKITPEPFAAGPREGAKTGRPLIV